LSDPSPDQTPIDFDAIEVVPDDGTPEFDDETYASVADEEMSDEPDEESADEDGEESLDDEDDDEGGADDASEELLELRRKNAEYNELQRRLDYQAQQQRNAEYWNGIESQAEAAFEAKMAQIKTDMHRYVDPEGYFEQKTGELTREIKHWYKQFEGSKNQARAKAQEQAAIPVYAARVAMHYGLSESQAHELLEYDPRRMDYEAQIRARHNAQVAKLRKNSQQTQRATARGPLAANPVGTGNSGRGAPTKVRAGSMNHLHAILAAAQAGTQLS
jgi:hypothetical protein